MQKCKQRYITFNIFRYRITHNFRNYHTRILTARHFIQFINALGIVKISEISTDLLHRKCMSNVQNSHFEKMQFREKITFQT